MNPQRLVRHRHHRTWVALAAAGLVPLASATAQLRTYTTDADFDAGVLAGVSHDVVHDELQLDVSTSTHSYVWIACSSRGTLMRLDAATGAVLGEYRTAPGSRGRNPSRTAIDAQGNVWTGNRSEAQLGSGSVVQVGLVIGGTRVTKLANGSTVPDPLGGYLAPPFVHCTAIDRDGDGLIRTSRGAGDILGWTDLQNGAGGPTGVIVDAVDECIRVYQRTTAPSIHQVSIGPNGDVWVGSYPSCVFDVLNGANGALLRSLTLDGGSYGGGFDADGILWSANPGQGTLLRYDPVSGTTLRVPVAQATGLAFGPDHFQWTSMGTNNTVHKLDQQGALAPGFPSPAFGGNGFGIVVTSDGDVWVANTSSNTVTRLAGGLSLRKRITVGVSPNGLTVDSNGKIWVTCQTPSTAVRIDPHGGADGLGAIDLTVTLGSGAGPQNYSGMSRQFSVSNVAPSGTWTVVCDGGRAALDWSGIVWHSREPVGTQVSVFARAADAVEALPGKSWMPIVNGANLRGTGLTGRHLEVRARLDRPGSAASPALLALALYANGAPDVTAAQPSHERLWPPNHRMVDVSILGLVDPDGDAVAVEITGITQDEPVYGAGRGRAEPDAAGIGGSVAQLRAERGDSPRAGKNGRVYTISFRATDGMGGATEGSVSVCVPHDVNDECVDDGQLYNSTTASMTGAGPLAARLFPNPFNPTTSLSYVLPEAGHVQLAIYDARGRVVRRLVDASQGAGEQVVLWDGHDDRGSVLPSGVYIYLVQSGELRSTGRMLLVK